MNVIKIENLWKEYRLGVIGHGTLTQDLQSWWAKIRGKDDPNSKIAPTLKGQAKQIEGNRFWALQDINLEVKQGEVLGIIGRNGAGKSTLLKILSRVTAPSKGRIAVKGRIASLLEVGTGFHPELTGRENVYLNGAILGMSKNEINCKFDEILDFSGIETFIDTPVKRYSSGMYVRLAFAVAAHLEPEILVIDEVLAVGDSEFQEKCIGKIGSVASGGRTVLFVSHNMHSINSLCQRCMIIESGEVDFDGATPIAIEKYSHDFKKNRSCVLYGDLGIINIETVKVSGDHTGNELFIDNKIFIKIEYKIRDSGLRVSPNINLRDEKGTLIFCSHQIIPFVSEKNITYLTTVTIPANFLNSILYYIDFSIGNPHPLETYAYFEKVAMFNVKETYTGKTARGELSVTQLPGLVSPLLEWTTMKL